MVKRGNRRWEWWSGLQQLLFYTFILGHTFIHQLQMRSLRSSLSQLQIQCSGLFTNLMACIWIHILVEFFRKKKTNFGGHEDVGHKRFQQIDQSKETILKPQLHLNSILPLLLPLQTKYTSSHKSQQIYLFPFYIFFTSFSSLVPSCVIHKFHSLFCFGD